MIDQPLVARRYHCSQLVRPDLSVLADAIMDVGDDGRITHVGPAESAPAGPGEAACLDGIVAPGLVNAHAHTPMSLMRSCGDGLALDDWLRTAVWPREARLTAQAAYWGQALGVSEMLRSGVTTHSEMYFYEKEVIAASRALGSRLVLAPAVIDTVHGRDIEGRLDYIADLIADHHRPQEGVSIGIGPHGTYTLADKSLALIAEKAAELEALVQIHLEETEAERQMVIEERGRSATTLLSEVGLLDGRMLAAHGVWLDDSDLDRLAAAGASLVHCPQSNLKLGSGIADVVAWTSRGVNAALGTDGPASNDSLDLWFELKLAPGLARAINHDPTALSAADAYRMATVGGAKALGLDDVGTLAPGFLADFVLLDSKHSSLVPALSDSELIGHMVFAGSGRAVTDVWVGGRQVVADGIVQGLDHEEIVVKASQYGSGLL